MCIFSTSVTFFHAIPKPSFLTYLQGPLVLSRLPDLSCRNAFKIFTVKVIHSALRSIPITGVSSLPQPLLTFCHSLLLRKGSCRVRSYIFRSIYPHIYPRQNPQLLRFALFCTLIPNLWPDVIRVPRAGTSPPASFTVTGEPFALSEWLAVAMIR